MTEVQGVPRVGRGLSVSLLGSEVGAWPGSLIPEWTGGIVYSKTQCLALTSVAQWVGRHPTD